MPSLPISESPGAIAQRNYDRLARQLLERNEAELRKVIGDMRAHGVGYWQMDIDGSVVRLEIYKDA